MAVTSHLDSLLDNWKALLTNWAASGQLTAAATEALQLNTEPEPLRKLVDQWSQGDFSGLPPIALLPSSSMPGAAGAYAVSTETIFLNQDWLETASNDWALSVLTEELGHHLDSLLNATDTPGDEGKAFFQKLLTSQQEPTAINANDDHGAIYMNNVKVEVEFATQYTGPWFLSGSTDYVGPFKSYQLPNRDLYNWNDGDEVYVRAVREGKNFPFTLDGPSGNYDRLTWSFRDSQGSIPRSGTLRQGKRLSTRIFVPKNNTSGDDRLAYLSVYYSNSKYEWLTRSSTFAFGIKDTSKAAQPSVTVAVSTPSVAEDEAKNLVYTFTRTGPATSELTINYKIRGTARLSATPKEPADYLIADNTSTKAIRSVTFAAEESTAAVKIIPIADTRTESDETVTLRLTPGTGYKIGSTAVASGLIVNDDIYSRNSRTLIATEKNLTLVGGKRSNGIGNDLDNALIGNSKNNKLFGMTGKDILTGGGGARDRDVFAYSALNESSLSALDEITDFNNKDRILAPFSVNTELLVESTGNASELTQTAIQAVLTNAEFIADSVAAFTVSRQDGTFIAMNDSRAGFQSDSDAIIFLKGYALSPTNFVDFV